MTLPLVVALLIGAAIALQAAMVSDATATVHPLTVSLALLISGLLVASAWATAYGQWTQTLRIVTQWWWFPLGVAGWVIVAALGWTASRLGIAVALALVVGAQLTVGLGLDVVRGAPIGWRSLAGVTLVVVGAVLLNSADNG